MLAYQVLADGIALTYRPGRTPGVGVWCRDKRVMVRRVLEHGVFVDDALCDGEHVTRRVSEVSAVQDVLTLVAGTQVNVVSLRSCF
jgi:hypothetical protein